jgi:2-dehydro-3-deoxygluconokinase
VTRGAVVTIGESMALLTVPAGRQLRGGASAPVGFGGAESNVAIGLARLDVPVSWVSRVGDDAFGSLITRELRGEGVQVLSAVDGQAPTGLMVKEHRYGTPWRVRYYRAGSAASRLDPADLDTGAVTDAITAARVLHLTGITAAISPSALATVRRAIDIARAAGTVVSFDVNHRSALWSDAQAAPVLAQLCGSADLVFAGEAEAALVLGAVEHDDGHERASSQQDRGSHGGGHRTSSSWTAVSDSSSSRVGRPSQSPGTWHTAPPSRLPRRRQSIVEQPSTRALR